MGRKKLQVWSHFLAVNDKGKTSFLCKYCGKIYGVKNITKKCKHLIQCEKCPLGIRNNLAQSKEGLHQTGKERTHRKKELPMGSSHKTPTNKNDSAAELTSVGSLVPLCESIYRNKNTDLEIAEGSNTFQSSQHSRQQAFHASPYQKTLIEKLCQAIYFTGMPFSLVENPFWMEFWKFLQPSFIPPKKAEVSSVYLASEYDNLNENIILKLKGCQNLHLQCNVLSGLQNEVLSLSLSTPQQIFLKHISLNILENNTGSPSLCQELENVIAKYAPEKLFVIVGDDIPDVQEALQEVKRTYNHVVPVKCLVHPLQRLCADILNCHSTSNLFASVSKIITMISESQVLSETMSAISEIKNWHQLLIMPTKASHQSCLFLLETFKMHQLSLKKLAGMKKKSNTFQEMDNETRELLQNDKRFWLPIENVISMLKPLSSLICALEEHKVEIYQVYDEFCEMRTNLIESISKSYLSKEEKDQFTSKLGTMKDHSIVPIHYAASLLNPASQGENLSALEILEAMEFVDETAQHMDNVNEATVMEELVFYRSRSSGMWGKDFLWKSADRMTPTVWWVGVCTHTQLSKVASRILSAPVSSSCCKHSAAPDLDRNIEESKLTTEQAEKLKFLYFNRKLLIPEQSDSLKTSEAECVSEVENKKMKEDAVSVEQNFFLNDDHCKQEMIEEIAYEYEWLESDNEDN